MPVVQGEKRLADFRGHWSGERLFGLLKKCRGRMRIDWAIGVGKSHSLDALLDAVAASQRYDLVVVLLPTRRVLEERKWIQQPPAGVSIVNLRPRPKERCGQTRNASWKEYEAADLGLLGRSEICGHCPHRRGCFWPDQYGGALEKAHVIFGTQSHLERSPMFLSQLRLWTKATSLIVLLDEVNCIMASFKRRISRETLEVFVMTLKGMSPRRRKKAHADWTYRAQLLLCASTPDLRSPDWRMPWVDSRWALAVQANGRRRFGESFCFLGYDLSQFGCSPLDSRERRRNGDIHFAASPYLGCDFVIFSGTANREFAKFRLGKDFESPFEDYRFENPGTAWYNIASNIGTRAYFLRNSKQILDFFASLVIRRFREGRRPLLVAKKCFVSQCADGIKERLLAASVRGVKVVTEDFEKADLRSSKSVPLITYGIVGTNLFEDFDCAYCLMGYYVTERVVNAVFQDVLASDGKIPIEIRNRGLPRRRSACVKHPRDRIYDVNRLADLALYQQEMDVVLQAVGRVRPYTRPREVVTFQCAALPDRPYTQESLTASPKPGNSSRLKRNGAKKSPRSPRESWPRERPVTHKSKPQRNAA